MSWDANLYAQKDAPVKDVEEWAVLVGLSEKADDDGCNAYQSQPTLAKRTRLSVKTVARRLKEMEGRGLLRRGDQRVVAHLPADSRPVVYDIQIPYAWFPNIDRINEYRRERDRGPLTPELRPPLGPAPEKKARVDKGTTRSREDDGTDQDESDEPSTPPTQPVDNQATGLQVPAYEPDNWTGLQDRPDLKSEGTGLQVHGDRTSSPTTLGFDSSKDSLEAPPPTSSWSAPVIADDQEEESKISREPANQEPALVGDNLPASFWPTLTDWEQDLHRDCLALRPDWSARRLRQVLGHPVIRERTEHDPDLVRRAFLLGAQTGRTATPKRLLHDYCPHWKQALAQRTREETPAEPDDQPAAAAVRVAAMAGAYRAPVGEPGRIAPPTSEYRAMREKLAAKPKPAEPAGPRGLDRLPPVDGVWKPPVPVDAG